jgi:formylglycine-generating enzyme
MTYLGNKKISLGQDFEVYLPIQSTCKPLSMLFVKPGTFNMGYSSNPNVLKSDHSFEVTLSAGYWLGEFLVTQAQWKEVMGNNPSYFKGQNLPVENIN